MSNVIQLPVIAGVEITTDAEGRFNLNALHKASKLGDGKKPSKWLRTDTAAALIDELEVHISPTKPINTVKGRGITGSVAHELIAISYAGWISPVFQLKVNQVFLDCRTGNLQPVIPRSLPEALRLAAELAEENEKMKDSVKALERISESDGSHCITDTAKALKVRPRALFKKMNEWRWIYKRAGGKAWIGYQDKIQSGYIEHKETTVSRSDGSEKVTIQALITAKGAAKLSSILNSKEQCYE